MYNFKDKTVYQIWPRSFMDSNGDGIGDLRGIIGKLDYLQSLGIDVIWLSPIYRTHNRDYGYDIDDYYDINPEFGTMADFNELLSEAKARGIDIIMDLVVNHTSDRHKWFTEAIKSVDSPYRDYYIFRDGRPASEHPGTKLPIEGGTIPPNNWLSAFGGSAWQKDPASGQYYLTTFTPNQCDLNWENERVREGVLDILRFWLDKGVAGFRMDVINTIAKAEGLPDSGNPKTLNFPFEHIVSLPKSHDYIREMNEKVLSHYNCFTVGEGMVTPLAQLNAYTDPANHELDMMFQFDLALIGCGPLGKYDFRKLYHWTVKEFKNIVNDWQTGTEAGGGWLGNYLSNHDQPRQVSRFGSDGRYRRESAKALAMLNLTLRGTPFIYQGEEFGMTNCVLQPEEWKDFEAINDYEVLQTMMHVPAPLAKKIVMKMTRDHARTPVQWNADKNAGFTTGEPWMKLNPNYTRVNCAAELRRQGSVTDFYKQLIRYRKLHKELRYGSFRMIAKNNPRVIAYVREYKGQASLVVINLTEKPASVDISDVGYKLGHCMLANYEDEKYSRVMTLKPYEGRIYKVKSPIEKQAQA